ncbi:MAG: helix-turn-helix domain-containing protein [Syntrophorhabdales bacterium]|jgi:excisionase family DNA binding protein
MDTANLIPLKDVPEILRVSKATLWRYVKQGKLSVVRYSERKVFIKKEELERFLQAAEK